MTDTPTTKARIDLSAREVEALLEQIDRRLDSIGLETQPEVASKVLDLADSASSGAADFADIVRADPALTGRVLRMANSAFFALSNPVTSVDRACVVLGIERLRSIAISFFLSRGSEQDPARMLSRQTWTNAVYRACLCSSLARAYAPQLESEAFVAGLLLDAGIPVAYQMQREEGKELYLQAIPPAQLFRHETHKLPFTHVDVVCAMARRWSLPDVLSHPIVWHHEEPCSQTPKTESQLLHRLTYVVGGICLHGKRALSAEDFPFDVARKQLRLERKQMEDAVHTAREQHQATSYKLECVAHGEHNLATLADEVSRRIQSRMDSEMIHSIKRDCRSTPERFILGGRTIELCGDATSPHVSVCLLDSREKPLASLRISPAEQTARSISSALGLKVRDDDEVMLIDEFLRALAA
ncbi:MAG: HDOD domain-containing protein [Phycisphaeraceae bacterium]|nr:HDOD domain-containing protein [Phycisphaerales bacterium]MCB9858941.1 HDOD domain-containing protein [Phycisphaeraceae bacterium]